MDILEIIGVYIQYNTTNVYHKCSDKSIKQKIMTYPPDPICRSNLSSISIMGRPTKQDLKRFWHSVGWMFLGKIGQKWPETMGFYHGVLPSNVGAP